MIAVLIFEVIMLIGAGLCWWAEVKRREHLQTLIDGYLAKMTDDALLIQSLMMFYRTTEPIVSRMHRHRHDSWATGWYAYATAEELDAAWSALGAQKRREQ